MAAAIDVDAIRSSVADAAAAAAALGRALTATVRALDSAGGEGAPASPPRAARPPRTTPGPVRLPAPLPPGIFEDEPAAAEHLVRRPGAVLVVDGYNASLRRWPDLALPEQRRRLTDALSALSARSGAEVHVVFDGADDQGGRSTGGARRGVTVTFSAGATEADEVIIDLPRRLPLVRPVVVATDDRRVRRTCAAAGANVISQAQLFALL